MAAVLDRPEPARRTAARQRAEEFGWPAAVAGFLAAHGLTAVAGPAGGDAPAARQVCWEYAGPAAAALAVGSTGVA